MARFEKNITIDAPVEQVFNYVQDPKNFLEWMASMTNVRDIPSITMGYLGIESKEVHDILMNEIG